MILFLVSCLNEKTAVNTLKTYIEKRFNTRITKIEVSTYLTGDLLENVNKLTEKEFQNYAELNKHKLIDLEILSEECSEIECVITYDLLYHINDDKVGTPKAGVKKIAYILKENDDWKISRIENLKTSFEFLDPLEVKAGTVP